MDIDLLTGNGWGPRSQEIRRQGHEGHKASVIVDGGTRTGAISCRTVAIYRHTIRPRMDGKQYGTNRSLTRAVRHSECRIEVVCCSRGSAHDTRACSENQASQHISARLRPGERSRSSCDRKG